MQVQFILCKPLLLSLRVDQWISYLISEKNEYLLFILAICILASLTVVSFLLPQVKNLTNWRLQLLLLQVAPVRGS